MKSNFLFIRIFSVLTVAILLAGSSFGQGKGHGGGGGRGGGGNPGGPPQQQRGGGGGNPGGGQERRGGGNPWGGGGGQQRQQMQQVQRQQVQVQRQQMQQVQRQQVQVQRQQMQQVQRQQMQAQRQQAQQWQNSQRQQMQVQRQQMQAQRQQAQQWQQVQRQQRGQQRDSARQQQMQQRQWQNAQRQQQRVYAQPQQPQTNWGQIRRQQAFDAKRERDVLKYQERANRDAWKYQRNHQKFDDRAYRRSSPDYSQATPYVYEQRESWLNNSLYQPRYQEYQNYDPGYGGYQTYGSSYPQYYQPDYRVYDYAQGYYPYPGSYAGYGYDNGYYGYQRSSWVEPLIRSVIATFFSNGIGNGYYDDYAYGDPYYGNGYAYDPQYSSYEPTYYTFGYAPTYTYYEPASYYGYDQYAYNTIPYGAFQGALPYDDVVSIYSGGLAGELIQRALGTGYYQGLLEGQMAQRRGWGDRYYSDPYLYEQAIYDPYSSSLGDNRRYFSEGYEMGYQDALRGEDDFDLADGGEVDLVSLLLGNVLSLRG